MADAEVRLRAVDQTRAAFQSVESQLGRLRTSAVSVQTALGALGVVGAGAAFAGLVRNSLSAADGLNKLSQRSGIAVETLSELQYAAKLSDVSSEALGISLRTLAKNIDGNAEGFARLGVESRNTDGTLRKTDQVLLDIADKFANLEDGAGKAALAQELLGRSGTDLIPLLNQGRAGLAAYADEARRAGLVISGETAKAAEEFNDNMTRLRSNAEGLAQVFASELVVPLARLTTQLLDASRAAGSLGEGLARSLLGQGRDLPNELQQIEVRIAAIRLERDRLRGSLGDTSLARAIPGLSRVQDLEGQEQALRLQRDYLKGLLEVRQERARAEEALSRSKTGKIAPVVDEKALAAEKRALAEREREAVESARRIGAQTAALADDKAEVAAARLKVELDAMKDADRIKVESAKKTQAELDQLLGETAIGQVKELQAQLETLAQAGANVPVEQQAQYEQAFEILNNRLQQAKGVSAEAFNRVGEDGTKAFRDLEAAVRGWGNQFTDTLADAIMQGKLDFADLANSIIRDLLRIQIQQSITAPLLAGATSALGGLFGGGRTPVGLSSAIGARAAGGPVSGGRPYLVGERGPELFIPGASGMIAANDTLGGVTVVQNIHVDSRSDQASIMQAMEAARLSTLASISQQRRRGR